MTQAIMIQNEFNIPQHARYAITPKGQVYMTGGYHLFTKTFSNEAYILDEYRSDFKSVGNMYYRRADHAVHFFKDNIFVFGGMAYREDRNGGKPFVETIDSCEFLSLQTNKWVMMPNFSKARQSFSVCQFNNNYIFIIGGKCLRPEARIGGPMEFDFVQEVEAFDIEYNQWKTINYISNNERLRIINPGVTQVTSKKIIIFGGLVEDLEGDADEDQVMYDNGQRVKLTTATWLLDVTKGTMKSGPELSTPSYYLGNAGSLICHEN
jgi:N-acetylneuraminic acid mutarotase